MTTLQHDETIPAIDSRNCCVAYGSNVVLNDVTFEVPSGSLVGVVGPNGAGKSTLFKTLVGVVSPSEGQVHVHGVNPLDARGIVAYVPQSETVNWSFPVSVWDVVMMGRTPRIGAFRIATKKDRRIVSGALERVGLLHRRSAMIHDLSGGQRARVFVARALAQETDVMLLDEAFSGVDVGSQYELVDVLRQLTHEGITILLSTHDLNNMALNMDLVLCLNTHVCACGPPKEVFTQEVLSELYGPHVATFQNIL